MRLTPLWVTEGVSFCFSVDWLVCLVAHCPHLVTESLTETLQRTWSQISPVHLLSILTPSSLVLLAQAPKPEQSWKKVRCKQTCIATYFITYLPFESFRNL